MATLTGTTPANTYGNLLQIPNSNNGVDSTLRTVQDGKGNNTQLKLSTTAVGVGSIANLENILFKYYSLADYGGVGDGVIFTDAAITSGTATLTSATASFTSSDTNKSIRVAGAGVAGADLLTTITFVNSTTVTLGTNASTTVSSAYIYIGTDNAAAFQAAFAAIVTANKSGIVFLPFTGKRYFLFGSLVTSVDGINPNCQVYIPKTLISNTTQIMIKVVGEVPGVLVYGGNSTHEYVSGVVIQSMILGSGTAPAMFAASFNSSGGGGTTNFTHTSVIFENVTLKVRSKTGTTHIAPTMSAADFSKVIAASVYNSVSCTESALATESVQPTDATVTGWRWPGILNTAVLNGEAVNVAAYGFYNGIVLYDHTHMFNLATSGCVRGLVTETSDSLGNIIGKYFCDGAIYPIVFNGNNSISIDYFSFENNGLGRWYAVNTIFYQPGVASTTGFICYDIGSTTFSSSVLNGNINLIDVTDKRDGVLLTDIASSSGLVALGIRDVPARNPGAGTNFATSFNIGPKGSGLSATAKGYLNLYNTDPVSAAANFEILQLGAAGTNGYHFNIIKNGSGSLRAFNFRMDGNNVFGIDTSARLTLDRTITAAGTTGNQTINKISGTVNIAATGTSVTVTNNKVDASSIVHAVLRTSDTTATGIKCVVCSSGSFVITLNAATTAEVSIGFLVTN